MRTLYGPLLRIRLEHGFYSDGRSLADFGIRPAPATDAWLRARGLIVRTTPGELGIYAELVPDAVPARLVRPFEVEAPPLRFLLSPRHPHLWSISALPAYKPGREAFCFDNLRDDPDGGRLYLGDAVAGTRVGPAVQVQTGEVLEHAFDAPTRSADLELRDRFGRVLASERLRIPASQAPAETFRFPLRGIPGLIPGRCLVSDDAGGATPFYYAPDVFAEPLFGILDLYLSTAHLTPGGSDQVPAAYRVLVGDRPVGPEAFSLRIQARPTRWRYTVVKKYTSNSVALNGLSVVGPRTFVPALASDRVLFTADGPPLPMSETARKVTLNHGGAELFDLPNPSAATPLGQDVAGDIVFSDMFVYV